MRTLLLFVLLGLAAAAPARMYQWVNSGTGTVEMSGDPPAWYRGVAPGPRVQVYERGQIIDDTAIALDPAQAQELRQAAFREFEERREAEAVKRLERAARREAARRTLAEQRSGEGAPVGETPATETAGSSPEVVPESLDQSVIDQLKSLIQTWDQQGGAPQ